VVQRPIFLSSVSFEAMFDAIALQSAAQCPVCGPVLKESTMKISSAQPETLAKQASRWSSSLNVGTRTEMGVFTIVCEIE